MNLLGLRTQKVSVGQLSLPGESDTASLKSDGLSLNSYHSEPTPNMCVVLYSYEVFRTYPFYIITCIHFKGMHPLNNNVSFSYNIYPLYKTMY